MIGVEAFERCSDVLLGADHLVERLLATLLLVIVHAVVLLRQTMLLAEDVVCEISKPINTRIRSWNCTQILYLISKNAKNDEHMNWCICKN
jgi:hypothetical protein